jgi:hypothetical protein
MVKVYAVAMTGLIVANILSPNQVAGALCLAIVILLIVKWVNDKKKGL